MPDEHTRCGVCGLLHPLVTVCPYIQEQEIREEFVPDGQRRRLAARIVRTRYFPRPEIAQASLVSVEEGPEEAEEPRRAGEAPTQGAVAARDAG
jgi:hypothetical protein